MNMSTTQQNQGGRTGFFSRFSKLGGSASAAGTTGSGTGTAVPPSSIASSQQTKRTSTASDLLVGPTASAATQATVVAGGTNASGGPSPGAGAGKGVVSPMDLLLLPTPPTSPYSTTTVHLGSGTFGPVDLAVHTATNESFALKRLATGQPIEDPLERRMLMNELLFGQTLVHPAIIKSYEAVQDQSDRDPAATASGGSSVSRTYSERSYDTAGTAVDSRSDDGSRSRRGADGKAKPANEIRLAMEVCAGGGLLKHLLEKGTSGYGLGEVEARRMFRQLIGAVAYLHKVSFEGIFVFWDGQAQPGSCYLPLRPLPFTCLTLKFLRTLSILAALHRPPRSQARQPLTRHQQQHQAHRLWYGHIL